MTWCPGRCGARSSARGRCRRRSHRGPRPVGQHPHLGLPHHDPDVLAVQPRRLARGAARTSGPSGTGPRRTPMVRVPVMTGWMLAVEPVVPSVSPGMATDRLDSAGRKFDVEQLVAVVAGRYRGERVRITVSLLMTVRVPPTASCTVLGLNFQLNGPACTIVDRGRARRGRLRGRAVGRRLEGGTGAALAHQHDRGAGQCQRRRGRRDPTDQTTAPARPPCASWNSAARRTGGPADSALAGENHPCGRLLVPPA